MSAMERPPWKQHDTVAIPELEALAERQVRKRQMKLGIDPLNPHGDGTIREGDPMYQLLLGGAVRATRSQDDPEDWNVVTIENGPKIHNTEATVTSKDWYEPVSNKPDKPLVPLADKIFAGLFGLLGVYFLLVGFGVIERDLDTWSRVFYIAFAVFDFVLVYLNWNRRRMGW